LGRVAARIWDSLHSLRRLSEAPLPPRAKTTVNFSLVIENVVMAQWHKALQLDRIHRQAPVHEGKDLANVNLQQHFRLLFHLIARHRGEASAATCSS
jgi:hypothetical protein